MLTQLESALGISVIDEQQVNKTHTPRPFAPSDSRIPKGIDNSHTRT